MVVLNILDFIFLEEKSEGLNWKFCRHASRVQEEHHLTGENEISLWSRTALCLRLWGGSHVCGYFVLARKHKLKKKKNEENLKPKPLKKNKPLLFKVFFPKDLSCFTRGVRSFNGQQTIGYSFEIPRRTTDRLDMWLKSGTLKFYKTKWRRAPNSPKNFNCQMVKTLNCF